MDLHLRRRRHLRFNAPVLLSLALFATVAVAWPLSYSRTFGGLRLQRAADGRVVDGHHSCCTGGACR